nr:unnamed protein product [uncultured bacterium]
MADNNAFNAQGAGLTSQETEIDHSVSNHRDRNHFDLSYNFYNTQLFGLLTPSMCFDAIQRDTIKYQSGHAMRTYTLASPLLNGITVYKDTFRVPMAAISEHAWQYIKSNPVAGTDIDFRAVSPILSPYELCSFLNHEYAFLKSLISNSNPPSDFNGTYRFFHFLNLLNLVLSESSLPNSLGINLSIYPASFNSSGQPIAKRSYTHCLYIFLKLIGHPLVLSFSHKSDFRTYSFDISKTVEFRGFLEFLQYSYCLSPNEWLVDDFSKEKFVSLLHFLANAFISDEAVPLVDLPSDIFVTSWVAPPDSIESSELSKYYVNISRLVAYQLICSQFYTNDSIDPVNDSHKWHNAQMKLYTSTGLSATFFNSAGVDILNDSCCGEYIHNILDTSTALSVKVNSYGYLYNLFMYNRALKYSDYFITSKTRPYAVGSSEIVVGDGVTGIDLTRSLLVQRFLNACNRIGNNFLEFAKRMGGTLPTTRDAQPYILSSETFNVDNFEVENTAQDQGNVTTNLKSYDSKFSFEAFIDEDSIIMQLCSVRCKTAYNNYLDKHVSHIDRFDFFTPMLQDLGDINVSSRELDAGSYSTTSVFGYKPVYSEYRETYDKVSGGFVTSLQSWIYQNDFKRPYKGDFKYSHIDDSFIRFTPSNFDYFYSSLTGLGADYYHFIFKHLNQIDAVRPIKDVPNLLF